MNEDQKIKSLKEFKLVGTAQGILSRTFILGLLVVAIYSCDQRKELIDAPQYIGPISSMDSAITQVSDSGIVFMQMKAPTQDSFENGDREWPHGFQIEWYNKRGQVTSFFRANHVFFNKSKNIYHATGNVVVRSFVKQDKLTTEELFWDQLGHTFYTEKFVTIESDDEVHTGEGMESNEDFTEYRILKPNGTFSLEDDPNRPSQRQIPLSPAKKQ